MVDWQSILPASILGGVVTFGGQAFVAWLKNRGDLATSRTAADVDLAKHKDGLTAEILGMARTEVSAARTEMAALREMVEKIRPMEAHFYELEQALDHLDALLNASPDERPAVERAAKAFVKRMKRTAEARGTIVNEAQRLLSGLNIADDKAAAAMPGSPSKP